MTNVTTCITNLIPVLPIMMVILSITLFRRSTRISMLIGSGCAVAIALLSGTSLIDILHLSGNLLVSTITDNWPLFISLLVFGMFVYTITRSQAVIGLSDTVRSLFSSRTGFLICVIGCILLCSSDDYLDCIIVCMALTSCASYYGISSVRFAVLVNMLVASACTLLPSTWQPVISGSLVSAGVPSVLWQVYAFFPVISLCLVLGYSNGRASTSDTELTNSDSETASGTIPVSQTWNTADRLLSVLGVVMPAAVLAVTFAVLNLIEFEYALLAASVTALVVTILFYRHCNLISSDEMRAAWHEGLGVMGSLDLTLITIWMFTGLMTDLLHLDQLIVSLLQQFDVPVWMIPTIYFIGSALFGYLTSSAFASFRVMIPLAAASASLFGNAPAFYAMIIGATVSGSLFASQSLTADTLILTTQSAECEIRSAFLVQVRYTAATLIIGSMAYFTAGYLTFTVGNGAGLAAGLLLIIGSCILTSVIFNRHFHD